MSVAYRCNRCGSYHEIGGNARIEVHGRIGLECFSHEYDLCSTCRLEFEEFMEGAKAMTLRDKLMARLKRKD